MTDPDVPLNSRGTPRQRFDPLRDARPEFAGVDDLDEILRRRDEVAASLVEGLTDTVRREVEALGLSASVEGQAAICAAEGAAESSGSARAACLHQLRLTMAAIQAGKPAAAKDATEDVLSRRRERKAGA